MKDTMESRTEARKELLEELRKLQAEGFSAAQCQAQAVALKSGSKKVQKEAYAGD